MDDEREMMQAANEIEVRVQPVKKPLDVCLDIWARWSALSDYQITSGCANEQDTKEFMQAGEAIEAMVNSLSRRKWWAIKKSKGICTAWIFNDEVFADVLQEAEALLEPKMRNHVATRRYFN